ncbi:hypothetical protein Dsin_002483 [Dipteronia sinensis]|uniref:Ubiquitin-like protease family profile domain-containing protein n=1 Tax=Dipteronia sinensis TaxID=43782 RepID=A0AAE0EK08_9ROSI|nr:hypothetical protein Dsin_002483 [Dipteronia sinensis]
MFSVTSGFASKKRQQTYPTVYGQSINILDSRFYGRIMPTGVVGKPLLGWSVLKYQWSVEDLMVVCGQLPSGNWTWHDVDMVLIPYNIGRQHWLLANVDLSVGKIYLLNPFRQEVSTHIRSELITSLRWFLPSMLHRVQFHAKRRSVDTTYAMQDNPFRMSVVSTSRVPQQTRGGNCGAHTLRLAEYLLANRTEFDWMEDDMGAIREKMVVEVRTPRATMS